MVGHAFMGAAHSQAWRNVGCAFALEQPPEMALLCGRDLARTQAAAERYGWAGATGDWHEALERDDIDIVDICSPTNSHAAIAIGALHAGKHVLCEKPLALDQAEAVAMAAAAAQANGRGVRSMVGFNYRRVPALALARQLIASGRVGQVRHCRARYLQDWLVGPDVPMSWRLEREQAGSGALGDIGSHIIDLAWYLTQERLVSVSALSETFVAERPLPDKGAGRFLGGAAGTGKGRVSVDDAVVFFGRLSGGGLATFEATRFATGRKNALQIEVNGSEGSLAFDFEAMNELYLFDRNDGDLAGFRRVLVTEPTHRYLSGWWPPGHGLGYDHTFVNQAYDFLDAIATGTEPSPSFSEGLAVQRALSAVELSAGHGSRWTSIEGEG